MFTKKNCLIHLFFIVIAAGLYRYGIKAPDLTWNMFLALVSLDFAILTHFSKNEFHQIHHRCPLAFLLSKYILHGDRYCSYTLCQHSSMATRKYDSIYALCPKYFLWGHERCGEFKTYLLRLCHQILFGSA